MDRSVANARRQTRSLSEKSFEPTLFELEHSDSTEFTRGSRRPQVKEREREEGSFQVSVDCTIWEIPVT